MALHSVESLRSIRILCGSYNKIRFRTVELLDFYRVFGGSSGGGSAIPL